MERKTKVMLDAAIGAVLVLVCSSAVQCTLVRAAGGSSASSAQEASASSREQILESNEQPVREAENSIETQEATEASATVDKSSGPHQQAPGDATTALFALDALRSHAWQAEGDADVTIAFKDGSFVETDAEGAKVTAFEITGTTEGDDEGTVSMKLVRDGIGEELDTVVIVEGAEGELRITSDGFRCAHTYVQAGTGEEPVGVTGVTEPYTTLIEGKTDELASAVAAYCRDHVPTATEASFDGEVFLDVADGRVVATFHCDDKASTVLSVTYADGAFDIAG